MLDSSGLKSWYAVLVCCFLHHVMLPVFYLDGGKKVISQGRCTHIYFSSHPRIRWEQGGGGQSTGGVKEDTSPGDSATLTSPSALHAAPVGVRTGTCLGRGLREKRLLDGIGCSFWEVPNIPDQLPELFWDQLECE